MPEAVESGRVKLQGSLYFNLHHPGVSTTDVWDLKATTFSNHSLHTKRTSPFSSFPKYCTTGLMNIASPY